MMKRMWLILMALTLVLGIAAGCACTAEPTPTPTPMATPAQSPSPVPDSTMQPSPTDNMGDSTMTIPNFLVGTVVALEELPEKIRAAIDREYPEASVQSVTHAEHEGNQAYSITLTDKDGKNQSFYIAPDGSLIPEMTPGGETGTDPAASPDPSASPKPNAGDTPAVSPSASPKP